MFFTAKFFSIYVVVDTNKRKIVHKFMLLGPVGTGAWAWQRSNQENRWWGWRSYGRWTGGAWNQCDQRSEWRV